MSYVQPIVIQKTGTHEDIVSAVTLASYAAYLSRDTAQAFPYFWDEWLEDSFTKSVRRCDDELFAKICREHPKTVLMGIGESRVLAFGPMEEPFPKLIKKCQVANTEMPRVGWNRPPSKGFVISINPDVKMSTGKTAAQCAHAFFGYHIQFSSSLQSLRITNDKEVFEKLFTQKSDTVEIFDAGKTEIEPNTLTVIAGILR